jgi:hypothetical protein
VHAISPLQASISLRSTWADRRVAGGERRL